MKQFCTISLFLILFISAASAQHFIARYPLNVPVELSGANQSKDIDTAHTISYNEAELNLSGAGLYKSKVYRIESADSSVPSAFRYIVQAVDTLAGTDGLPFQMSSAAYASLDKIILTCGLSKHSQQPDTLIISLLPLNAAGFPQYSDNFLYRDTTLLDTSIGSWNAPLAFEIPLNFYLSVPLSYGIRIDFRGAAADTFTVAAGYSYGGFCTLNNDLALKSRFYPNSFAYYKNFDLLIPTLSGSDLYTDCTGDSIYTPGTDSENYIQNWAISHSIRAFTLQITEQSKTLLSIFPNPATETLYVNGAMHGSVLQILDMNGILIRQEKVLVSQPSISLNHLPSGMYILRNSGAGYTNHKLFIVTTPDAKK